MTQKVYLIMENNKALTSVPLTTTAYYYQQRPGNEKVADGIFGGPNGDFGNYNIGNMTQMELNRPRQRQTGE